LFVERTRAALPDFALTEDNAHAVADLCRRLDGMPLAIELAAARVRLLGVEQLAVRLHDRFRVLAGGSRTAPPRQQTLRATVAWSYELLVDSERRLFERLAVFAGGWTLDAAESACSGQGIESRDVLGLLGQLVDKSLVVVDAATKRLVRYRLLETIRQYALERLVASGDLARMARQHAAYYLMLAEQAEARLTGTEQGVWFDVVEREHENIRSALRASVQARASEQAARIGGALWRFWATRGYLTEGRAWLEQILQSTDAGLTPTARARALNAVAWLALLQADYVVAGTRSEESLVIRRAKGDVAGAAESLMNLAEVARQSGDIPRALELIQKSLLQHRAVGSKLGLADALNILGMIRLANRALDVAGAAEPLGESLEIRRSIGDVRGVASSLANLGDLAFAANDVERAVLCYQESLDIRRGLGDVRGVAMVLALLGDAERSQGRIDRARALFQEGLDIATRLGAARQVAACRTGLASLTYATEGARRGERPRRAASPPAAAGSTGEGQPNAIASRGCDRQPRRGPEQLTFRERQVADLIAQGLTNRQIAQTLAVSERTVHTHVPAILAKLGFSSRVQIGTWAATQAD
jgi:non-specific serine/threonine protein kinase